MVAIDKESKYILRKLFSFELMELLHQMIPDLSHLLDRVRKPQFPEGHQKLALGVSMDHQTHEKIDIMIIVPFVGFWKNMGTKLSISVPWDTEIQFKRTCAEGSGIIAIALIVGTPFEKDLPFPFHDSLDQLLQEPMHGDLLLRFKSSEVFLQHLLNGFLFDSFKSLLIHPSPPFSNYLPLRHNNILTPIGGGTDSWKGVRGLW